MEDSLTEFFRLACAQLIDDNARPTTGFDNRRGVPSMSQYFIRYVERTIV